MKPNSTKFSAMTEIVNLDDCDLDHDHGDEGLGLGFFTPLSSKGNTKRTAISVEHYSEQRDLNMAIMLSLNSPKKLKPFIDLDDYDDKSDFDVKVLNFEPQTLISRKNRRFRDSVTEKGQSSKSEELPQPPEPEFLCQICFDPKPNNESFSIEGCIHSYCKNCMANYISSKLQENVSQISCPVPNCSGLLEPHYCRSILPEEVFDRWGNALCEAIILGSQKFYCPYEDCSVMLIDDGDDSIRESECPNCRRLFCAQCKVPWHAQIQCEEFQKLHKDEREREDLMLMKLAKNKDWRRCPKCRIFVERTQGCKYMKCRCGAAFCYGCGTEKISSASHYCNFCKG